MNYNKDPRRQENGYDPFGSPQVKRRYTPEEAGHEKHRKPVKRNSFNRLRRKKISINPAVVIVTLLFLLIAGLCIFLIVNVMENAIANGYSLEKMKLELTKAKHVDYKGRTEYYQMVLDILG